MAVIKSVRPSAAVQTLESSWVDFATFIISRPETAITFTLLSKSIPLIILSIYFSDLFCHYLQPFTVIVGGVFGEGIIYAHGSEAEF